MNQREALTQGFLRWLEQVVQGNKVSPGQSLAPFGTSTRVTKQMVPALVAVRAGQPIPPPDPVQRLADLRAVDLIDGTSPETAHFLPLGDRVEARWSSLGIATEDGEYGLARSICLIKEGLALRNEKYQAYWNFWLELRQLRPAAEWFSDPFNLYLASYLNRALDNYNPFRVLLAAGCKFGDDSPHQVWIEWRDDLSVGPVKTNLEKLLLAVDNYATRAKGRIDFCKGMELVYLRGSNPGAVVDTLSDWGI